MGRSPQSPWQLEYMDTAIKVTVSTNFSLCSSFKDWYSLDELCTSEKVNVAQSCRTLCDPMDYTVPGILQARILGSLSCLQEIFPGTKTQVSHISGRFFTI